MLARFLLVAAAAAWTTSPLAAQVDPGVQSALHDLAPAFRVREGPDALRTGDFDGDGTTDVVAIVTDGRQEALAIFHTGSDGVQAHLVNARLPAGAVKLRVVPPGRHRVLDARGSVILRTEAVELVLPGRWSAIYAWEGGRYRAFPTESYAEER